MTTLEDRGDAFEKKYAHEEKVGFEVEARCSKLFGLWAAEKIGLEGADADTYAGEVVAANLEEPGFNDILRKVRADFDEKNIEISDHLINVELDSALEEAKRQIIEKQKNT